MRPVLDSATSIVQPFTAVDPLPRLTSQMQLNRNDDCTPPGSDDEFPDFDITTLHVPKPNYDISERPWLPGPQKPHVIINAQVVDPRNSVVHKSQTLHLAGGKIVSIQETTEQDRRLDFYHGEVKAVKVDAEGYFVCPGLIDCRLNVILKVNSN